MRKAIGFFVSGAVTGAVVTYILMKNQQAKLEKQTQEEINSVKLAYKTGATEAVEDIEEDSEESEDKTDEDDEDDRRIMYDYNARSEKMRRANRARDEERKIFRSVQNQDYLDDLIDDEEEDEDDYDDDPYIGDDRDIESVPPSESSQNGPYSIDGPTFANTNNHFDKLTLIWYAVDDIIATEDNERLIDDGVIGYDWREQVGKYEPDVAYIRNEGIAVDYEIIKENLSFFKDAL